MSSQGRDDYFAVEAIGAGSHGEHVSVVLHVVHGLVHEIEVFAAGEDTPPVADLIGPADPVVG